MSRPDEPHIAQAVRELTAALAETLERGGLGVEPVAHRRPWPCEEAGKRAFAIGYDMVVSDPQMAVSAVVTYWKQRGFPFQIDHSRDHDQPEAIVRSGVFEMSVHGFPERNSVWLRGNTVCLAGEVPEDWRDVR